MVEIFVFLVAVGTYVRAYLTSDYVICDWFVSIYYVLDLDVELSLSICIKFLLFFFIPDNIFEVMIVLSLPLSGLIVSKSLSYFTWTCDESNHVSGFVTRLTDRSGMS